MMVINGRFLEASFFSGVQRYAWEIARRICWMREGDIYFCTPSGVSGSAIPTRKIGSLTGLLWEQLELPMYLKRNKNPLLLNLANTAPLKYSNQVVTIMDASFVRQKDSFTTLFRSYYSFLIPRIIKQAKMVITISEFSRQELASCFGLELDRITVIYCGVDRKKFYPLESKEKNKPRDDYILYVGSLDPRKNVLGLIQAFKSLRRLDLKLVIVGRANKRIFPNSYERRVLDLVSSDKRICFMDSVDDDKLAELYRRALCFVYPSFYEGFGLPPLEAMASGVPVVASDIPPLKEVCGQAAVYVNPKDVDSIARGISVLVTDEDLRRQMAKKGLERSQDFSWDSSAKKLLKRLEELEG